jgi:hypothetical protein
MWRANLNLSHAAPAVYPGNDVLVRELPSTGFTGTLPESWSVMSNMWNMCALAICCFQCLLVNMDGPAHLTQCGCVLQLQQCCGQLCVKTRSRLSLCSFDCLGANGGMCVATWLASCLSTLHLLQVFVCKLVRFTVACHLTRLAGCRKLGGNQLVGTLPASWSNMSRINILYVHVLLRAWNASLQLHCMSLVKHTQNTGRAGRELCGGA